MVALKNLLLLLEFLFFFSLNLFSSVLEISNKLLFSLDIFVSNNGPILPKNL
jgi:hypothetical protein